MDLEDTLKTYRLFSGSYDLLFGPVFHPGRKDAVRIANDRPGQRILEVGVGTGLSLPHFRPDSRVTGIDVSTEMLYPVLPMFVTQVLGASAGTLGGIGNKPGEKSVCQVEF